MKKILVLFLLLPGLTELFAETPVPTPSQKISDTSKVVDDDLLVFELEMAENGYTINKDLVSTTRLLKIYEKVVYRRCLSDIYRSLAYSGSTKDQLCLEYINKTLNIDPGNVVAFCAKEGIDSQICKAASERQKIKTFDPEREEKEHKASLEDVIAARKEGPEIREQTDVLLEKLKSVSYSSAKKKQNATSEKKALMSKVLDLNCKRSRIKLEELVKKEITESLSKPSSLIPPEEISATAKSDSPEAQSTPDPFAQMLNKHFKTPTPEAVIPQSFRVFQISIECNRFIEDALKIDPNFSLAHCYKWGFYSWQCINTKRLEARLSNKPVKSDTFIPPSGVIQKF